MPNILFIDPEIHGLIPPLSDAERELLEKNILRDGKILSPGITWHNTLLDGHNRREIAERHKLPFPTVAIDLPDRAAAFMWVVTHQEGRRNLSDFARSEMALKLKAALASEAESRKSRDNKPAALRQNSDGAQQGRTDEKLAEIAGVSRDTIRQVEKVKESGTPALVEAARKGDVSINAAAAVATLPKAEQRKIVAKGADAIKEAAKAARAKAEPKKPKAKPADKKNPTAPKDGPPVDAVGVPLPNKLRADFEAAPAFRSLMKRVSDLKSEFKKLCAERGWQWADRRQQKTVDYFDNAHAELRFAIPYGICPSCGGDGCDDCKQIGFLPEEMYKAVPDALKPLPRSSRGKAA